MKNKIANLDIIGRRKIYFAISLIILVPGLIALLLFGLNLSIDFTGGSRLTVELKNKVTDLDAQKVKEVLTDKKVRTYTL